MGSFLTRRNNWQYACVNIFVGDPESPAGDLQEIINSYAEDNWRIVQFEQHVRGGYVLLFEREWEQDSIE